MGSFQLEEEYKQLHCLEPNNKQNWFSVKVSAKDIKDLKTNKKSYYEVFNDGRKQY